MSTATRQGGGKAVGARNTGRSGPSWRVKDTLTFEIDTPEDF